MSLSLTPEELFDLTGYRSYRGQVAWLRSRGWVFDTRRNGSPHVSRSYYLHRTGTPDTIATATSSEPNWSAIA